MSAGDFLCQDAATPLCEFYTAAGAVCRLSTNCEPLLEAARESFLPIEDPPGSVDFSVRFWVDYANLAPQPWPKPRVRGLNHLVFAGFDSGSSMLADLPGRRVIGRFSPAIGNDRSHWQTIVFPMLLTITGASLGIVEIHSSSVAKAEKGLLLVGAGRSGKSTLAVALAQEGFGFLSDDRTFCSWQKGKLAAWGLATAFKLRSDAGSHFMEFKDKQPMDLPNGERGFRFDPKLALGLERVRCCHPRLLVFLERSEVPGFRLTELSSQEAGARLEDDLMEELPDAAAAQMQVIGMLAELPCCLLEYGGPPQVVARKLAQHFEQFR